MASPNDEFHNLVALAFAAGVKAAVDTVETANGREPLGRGMAGRGGDTAVNAQSSGSNAVSAAATVTAGVTALVAALDLRYAPHP
jgi:hypothetical protein